MLRRVIEGQTQAITKLVCGRLVRSAACMSGRASATNWQGHSRLRPVSRQACRLARRSRRLNGRKIRIQEAERVRRSNDSNSFAVLLISDLLMQFLHLGPVHFWPEMMLGVIPVIEPKQIVPFRIRTDSPRYRLIGVAPIMEKETIQVGATLPEIIEWQKEEPKLPVQNETDGDGCSQNCNLSNSPASIDPVLSLNLPVDRLRILPEVT